MGRLHWLNAVAMLVGILISSSYPGRPASAMSLDIFPAQPTIEDKIVLRLADTTVCASFDSVHSCVRDDQFDYHVWVTSISAPNIDCGLTEFNFVDTVGPLEEGTYNIRTAWHWHNVQYTEYLGDPHPCIVDTSFIVEKSFVVSGSLGMGENGVAHQSPLCTLNQNYPNPFNLGTTISFSLAEPTDVELSVYDILGRRVRQLARDVYPAGVHEVFFDGHNDTGAPLPSGMYFSRATTGTGIVTRRMVLLK